MEVNEDKEGIKSAYKQINYYRNMPNHIKVISITLYSNSNSNSEVTSFLFDTNKIQRTNIATF